MVDLPGHVAETVMALPALRGFCGSAGRQVHYRRWAGPGRPLLMFHPNPGSTRMLFPLIESLARDRGVIAFDTPGLGQSDPLAMDTPEIADYAERLCDALDELDLPEFDLYGAHTGANIATEIAIRFGDRARRLILDGMSMYDDESRRTLLARYAHPPAVGHDGAHLLWAWHFVRDQWCFFPWFQRDAERRRAVDLLDASYLNEVVVDVLDNLPGVAAAYRASFIYPKETRLPLLLPDTLILSTTTDIFYPELQKIASCLPSARVLAVAAMPDDPKREIREIAEACMAFLKAGKH
jgi:pimeloyl-ACP methyl ester carboxylesterase